MSSRGLASLWVALVLSPAAPQRLNEISASQVADRLLLEDHQVLVAPAAQDTIRRLGQTLVESSGNPELLQFTFTVLNDPVPNAFSFPGGYVYVTSGLLAIAESRDEVAAILAHEVAHVNAEHRIRTRFNNPFSSHPRFKRPHDSASKPPEPGSIAAGLGGIAAAVAGCAAAPIFCGAVAIISVFDLEPFNELWADELAIGYLRKAGFDANALAGMVGKLSAGWHRDWPPEKQKSPEERIWNIRRLMVS